MNTFTVTARPRAFWRRVERVLVSVALASREGSARRLSLSFSIALVAVSLAGIAGAHETSPFDDQANTSTPWSDGYDATDHWQNEPYHETLSSAISRKFRNGSGRPVNDLHITFNQPVDAATGVGGDISPFTDVTNAGTNRIILSGGELAHEALTGCMRFSSPGDGLAITEAHWSVNGVIDTDPIPASDIRCCPPCPSGAQLEGEPTCGPDYNDVFNGGCNSTPPVFSDVNCNTICGEMGTFLFNNQQYRDTDWYRVSGSGTYSGIADGFTLRLFVLTPVCPTAVLSTITTPACVQSANLNIPGPNNYLFAGTDVFSGVPCGTRYVLSISQYPGCGVTAVESTTWGNIKARYRD